MPAFTSLRQLTGTLAVLLLLVVGASIVLPSATHGNSFANNDIALDLPGATADADDKDAKCFPCPAHESYLLQTFTALPAVESAKTGETARAAPARAPPLL